MNRKNRAWLLAIFLSLSIFALPAAAQACWCCGKGGVIFNPDSGKFYSVPGTAGECVAYRSVDGKYYPVTKYGYCCHRHHHHKYVCYHRFVTVQCQVRPGHWFSGHWYPESNVCFYIVK